MKKVYCKDCKWNQETIFPYPYCVKKEVHVEYHNFILPTICPKYQHKCNENVIKEGE